MKVSIHYIYGVLLVGLLTAIIICFHNNQVLESRLNTISKYSISLNSEKSFKEDYYITQQSHDTNMILVVFTVLTGLVSFFTYVNVLERYNSKLTEIQNEHRKQNDKWDSYHNRFLVLETDLYYQIAYSDSNLTTKELLKEKPDINKYLNLSIACLEKYAIVLTKVPTESAIVNIHETMNIIIEHDFDLVNSTSDRFTNTINIEKFKNKVSKISETLDKEHFQMFNVILSKFELV